MADVHMNSDHDRKLALAIEKSLRLVGGQAERFAKELISDMGAVDTGFLRNSITWALDGEMPQTGIYQDDAGTQTGEYGLPAPESEDGNRTVYIGSNVYYAPYIEYGTRKMEARPFLSQSIQNHKREFEELFKQAFQHYF